MKRNIKGFIKTVAIAIIWMSLLIGLFFHATVETSLRNCPPTEAELAEDPSLARYLND